MGHNYSRVCLVQKDDSFPSRTLFFFISLKRHHFYQAIDKDLVGHGRINCVDDSANSCDCIVFAGLLRAAMLENLLQNY
jgi:hypothetical protein